NVRGVAARGTQGAREPRHGRVPRTRDGRCLPPLQRRDRRAAARELQGRDALHGRLESGPQGAGGTVPPRPRALRARIRRLPMTETGDAVRIRMLKPGTQSYFRVTSCVMAIAMLAVAALLAGCGTPSATVHTSRGEDLMLLGFDPVAYFTEHKPVRGLHTIAATTGG